MASSGSEDEDVKRAIALSLQVGTAADPSSHEGVARSTGILSGIDRKAMEQERLARQAARSGKRIRSISPPPISRPSKMIKPSKPMTTVFSTQDNCIRADGQDQAPSNLPQLQFPHGIVKKTWAYGHARTPSDIKIEEVLERTTLRTAVLSAFQWEPEWVLSKIHLGETKAIFVMQGKTAEEREHALMQTENVRDSLRLCFPSMEGNVNCMHSKLMLLFHPYKLRVVVPTANLVSYDWGESGMMENSVFMIDLPRLETDVVRPAMPPFGLELAYFVKRMGLHDMMPANALRDFDFSTTANMAFVHTVGGASYSNDMQRTGYMGLSKAVNDLGLQTAGLQLDFAASSIGSLNDDYLRAFHRAARGAEPQQEDMKPPSTSRSKTAKTAPAPAMEQPLDIRSKLRIYFPTLDTVRASKAGTAGTICLQRKWFEGTKFPAACFRDYKSVRQGLLSHNKLLYARGRAPAMNDNDDSDAQGVGHQVAWAYVGSANMSESAWGKVTLDRQRKERKNACRNWECGVLLPVLGGSGSRDFKEHVGQIGQETGEEQRDGMGEDVPAMSVFEERIGVPFEVPGRAYEGMEPWYFMER